MNTPHAIARLLDARQCSIKIILLISVFLNALVALAESPRVFIISPKDGDTVNSPVTIQFGLSGMGVAPAGVESANTGHHHLLINVDQLPPLNQPLGADVKHFGGGQTQTTLELPPGSHSLQLILGDHLHRPHEPPIISEKIRITVERPLSDIKIKNLQQISPLLYRSGQPTQKQMQALANHGVKHIINLRADGEVSWDEAALAKSLNMRYHHLPINGATDITNENAQALADLLASVSKEKTLVHCASSNRVGALVALQSKNDGKSVEQAIEQGKQWGLKSLEPVVRKAFEF